jgi:hypothetical protein
MRLDDSILERLIDRINELDMNSATMYSIINKLKDMYINIIEDGYVSDDTYINLAAFVLYSGFLMED